MLTALTGLLFRSAAPAETPAPASGAFGAPEGAASAIGDETLASARRWGDRLKGGVLDTWSKLGLERHEHCANASVLRPSVHDPAPGYFSKRVALLVHGEAFRGFNGLPKNFLHVGTHGVPYGQYGAQYRTVTYNGIVYAVTTVPIGYAQGGTAQPPETNAESEVKDAANN